VNLPGGSHVAYTVTGTVSAGATGTLSNTASVTVPSGVTDPDLSNNLATDVDVIGGSAAVLNFFTLAPCRLVDTRGDGAPIVGPALVGLQTRVLAVAGHCGIPSSAKAVAINVVVTEPTFAGNLRLFPAGQSVPTISTVNYGTGQTRANNAVLPLNASGELAAFVSQPNGTTAHVIIDVSGYFE